jgi:hypothetical protein
LTAIRLLKFYVLSILSLFTLLYVKRNIVIGNKPSTKRCKTMDEQKQKKKGGKKEEPKYEELEFIAKCFLKGLSDKEVLVEMEGEPFNLRTKGFIRRRRREFDAYRKVVEKEAQKVFDPIVIERRKEHWDELAKMAAQLFYYWDRYLNYKKIDNKGYIVSDEELEKIDWLTADFLLTHLKAEFPEEFAPISDWTNLIQKDYGEICVHRLGLVAKRKTFKGICTICQELSIK